MKIRKTFNTTKNELESRKFNIYVGISLGNKWFTKENLKKYLEWSLKHTKDKVLFLIADKIQALNYNVRNKKYSEEANLRRVKKAGRDIRKGLEEIISSLPREKKNKVKILDWWEYEEKSIFWKKYTPLIYKEFDKNKKFRIEILKLVSNVINDRKFSKEDYMGFSNYFLEEFIDLYSGVKIGKDYYGLYLYPSKSPVFNFIEKIQGRKLFPELNKKLPKEKVALAIVN